MEMFGRIENGRYGTWCNYERYSVTFTFPVSSWDRMNIRLQPTMDDGYPTVSREMRSLKRDNMAYY